MKIIIWLGLFCSITLAMQQPQQPLPLAQLQNYVLVSSNGKEIIFDGNLVREFLPGLAERVAIAAKQGMKEATGKVAIADLDGQALSNLKSLLTDYVNLKNSFEFQNERRAQHVTTQEYINLIASSNKRIQEQLTFRIENLPHIEDHFITLFHEMIGWGVPEVLQVAMARLAADLLTIPDAYQVMVNKDDPQKNTDPRVQLLYLSEAEFSVDSIIKVFEWFAELENNPTKLENFDLLSKVSTKIVEFTAPNVQLILAKYPHFRNLFEKPEFKSIGELLAQAFAKIPQIVFTRIIRPGQRWLFSQTTPFVSGLGDQIIALHDNNPANNIYDFKTDTFKSFRMFSNMGNRGCIFWKPQRIVCPSGKNIHIYDIGAEQKIFDQNLHLHSLISKILLLDNNIFLVWSDAVYKFIYDEKDKSYSFERVFGNEFAWEVTAINEQEYIAVNLNNFHIYRRNISQDKALKEVKLPVFRLVHAIKKINNNEVGIILEKHNLQFTYLILSIPDLKILSSEDFLVDRDVTKPIPLDAHHVLFKKNNGSVHIYNVISKETIPLEIFGDLVVLNKNHIATFDRKTNNFIIQFLPHVSSLNEIFDKLQENMPVAQQVVQPRRKRSVSPPAQAPRIPAAAKGLRPEVPETKQPRLEKPNG